MSTRSLVTTRRRVQCDSRSPAHPLPAPLHIPFLATTMDVSNGKESALAPKYVWYKLKNTGVDYTMILRERREWLLNQDLAKSQALLCEWFALVQELDNITREELGVDENGTKVVTAAEENDRRARARSFTNMKTSSSESRSYEVVQGNRPRSNSFLEFALAKDGTPPATPKKASNEENVATETSTRNSTNEYPTNVGEGESSGGNTSPRKIALKKKKKDKSKYDSSGTSEVTDQTGTRSSFSSPAVSPSKGGTVTVLKIKKKKSKTPNRALKKMFKVVEKKSTISEAETTNDQASLPATEMEKQKSWL